MSGVPIVPHPISQRSSYKVDGLRQLPSIRPEIFDGFTAEVLHPHPDTHVRMLGDFSLSRHHASELCPPQKGILSPGWLPGGKEFYKVT